MPSYFSNGGTALGEGAIAQEATDPNPPAPVIPVQFTGTPTPTTANPPVIPTTLQRPTTWAEPASYGVTSPRAIMAPPSPVVPASESLYRVEIRQTDRQTLARVQTVEPQAFVRQSQGVIQAGVFRNQENAFLRSQQLAHKGVQAQVVTVGTAPENPTVAPAAPQPTAIAINTTVTPSPRRYESGYYVVIPGHNHNLTEIAGKVSLRDKSAFYVAQKDSRRGDHVAIGPFVRRTEANAINRQVRRNGWDGRIYYRH